MSYCYDIQDSDRRRGQRKSKFFDQGRSGHLTLLALRVSRHWHKEPRWFEQQPKDVQIDIIAEYILHNETPETREERRKEYQKELIKKWQKK